MGVSCLLTAKGVTPAGQQTENAVGLTHSHPAADRHNIWW